MNHDADADKPPPYELTHNTIMIKDSAPQMYVDAIYRNGELLFGYLCFDKAIEAGSSSGIGVRLTLPDGFKAYQDKISYIYGNSAIGIKVEEIQVGSDGSFTLMTKSIYWYHMHSLLVPA